MSGVVERLEQWMDANRQDYGGALVSPLQTGDDCIREFRIMQSRSNWEFCKYLCRNDLQCNLY
jgi:hypothetical protein